MSIYWQIGVAVFLVPLFITAYIVTNRKIESSALAGYILRRRLGRRENEAEDVMGYILKALGKIIKPIMPGQAARERMRLLLIRAGMENVVPEQVYIVQISAMAAGGVLAATIFIPRLHFMLIFGGAAAGLGFILPKYYIKSRAKSRQNQAQRHILNYIELLSKTCNAGMEIRSAVEKVSTKMPGVLADEFRRTWQEIARGKRYVTAIEDMAKRLDVEDLNLLVEALVQADKYGTPIENVLQNQTDRIRDSAENRSMEIAQKAPLKMLVPTLIFILPPLFVFILGPVIVNISNTLNF